MPATPAALFDLDGTLVDSLPGIKQSVLHALRALGHPATDDTDITPLVGPPIAEGLAELLERYGDDRVAQLEQAARVAGWLCRQIMNFSRHISCKRPI